MVRAKNEGGEFLVEVLVAGEVRGPAAVAQALYRERGESRALRLKVADQRKEMLCAGGTVEGRPSKRDRQELARLRGRIHPFAINGMDSLALLDQALEAAGTFKPMTDAEVQQLLARTKDAAAKGAFEPFKTSSVFDGTAQNIEWLGEEPERLQKLMSA